MGPGAAPDFEDPHPGVHWIRGRQEQPDAVSVVDHPDQYPPGATGFKGDVVVAAAGYGVSMILKS